MTDTNDTPETQDEQPELDFDRDDERGGVSTKVGSLGWPEGAENEQNTGADGKVADVTTEDVK